MRHVADTCLCLRNRHDSAFEMSSVLMVTKCVRVYPDAFYCSGSASIPADGDCASHRAEGRQDNCTPAGRQLRCARAALPCPALQVASESRELLAIFLQVPMPIVRHLAALSRSKVLRARRVVDAQAADEEVDDQEADQVRAFDAA